MPRRCKPMFSVFGLSEAPCCALTDKNDLVVDVEFDNGLKAPMDWSEASRLLTTKLVEIKADCVASNGREASDETPDE